MNTAGGPLPARGALPAGPRAPVSPGARKRRATPQAVHLPNRRLRKGKSFVLKMLTLREWWSKSTGFQENPGGRTQMFRAVDHNGWCSLGIDQEMVVGQ